MIVNSFNYYEVVVLRGVPFKVHQPTLLDLDRIGFNVESSDVKLEVLALMDDSLLKILAQILTKKHPYLRKVVQFFLKHFVTWEEIKNAFVVFHGVAFGSTLFKSCNLDKVKSKAIDIIGGKTLLGQIPSFTEYLGFTLNEVLATPYPVLLLMCADKQRVLSDDDVVKTKVSGLDMMRKK